MHVVERRETFKEPCLQMSLGIIFIKLKLKLKIRTMWLSLTYNKHYKELVKLKYAENIVTP
jgi:hypothetical protein